MNPLNVEASSPNSLLVSSLLVGAKEGYRLHAFGHAIVVLLDGKQTGGKFTAFLNMTPPGGGPGPHYHEREDEWFYIIEGRVSFLLNGTWTELFPRDCVYSPRGSIHGFKNNTDQPIRVFINIAPAGFEHFFAESGEVWAQPEPDMSRMRLLSRNTGYMGSMRPIEPTRPKLRDAESGGNVLAHNQLLNTRSINL